MARDYAETLRGMLKLSTDTGTTQGERDHALDRALAFAAKHGIDIAMLEAETTGNLVISKRIAFRNPFAKDKGRLWSVVARHFGCDSIIISMKSNITRTYGYRSDLGLADTLYDLLWDHGCYELGMAVVPEYVSGRSFSTAFWAGYQSKISQRLNQAKNVAMAETTGAELVLASREDAVNNELAKDYPSTRKIQRGYIRSASGWSAGNAAGERASLGHPLNS
jgi:hypothetical protein